MYRQNPEEYLTNKRYLIKQKDQVIPIEEPPKQILNEEIKHNLEIEEKKLELTLEDGRWRSCCFDLHQESSLFFAKLSVSLFVITLCSYQLITLRDCNYQSLYSSLLSSIITFWLSKK